MSMTITTIIAYLYYDQNHKFQNAFYILNMIMILVFSSINVEL